MRGAGEGDGALEAGAGEEAGMAGRGWLVFGLMVGVALHAFHGVAIVTALPVIAADLDGRALYGAAIGVYLVASIVGLAGSAGPVARFGPRTVLRAGLAVFALGIVMSAAAPDMRWLVVARVVEGLGGGVITTVLYASVNLAYPAEQRARVLALLAAAWVVPTLGAPPLAAFVAESIGWRWVFLSVLPAVGVALVCTERPLGRLAVATASAAAGVGAATASAAAGVAEAVQPVSIRSALALAAGCGMFLAAGGVVTPPSGESSGAFGAGSLAAALAAAGLALVVATLDRVLPPGTATMRRGLPSAIGLKTWLALSFFGVEGFLPLATTELLGWTTLEAGLLLSGAGVTWTLGAFAESRLGGAARGRGAVLGAVLVLGGVAAAVLALDLGLARGWLYGAWWFAAFGMGIGYNVANACAMAMTEPGGEGATSSALGISDALGIAIGTGLGGLLIAAGDAAGRALGDAIALQGAIMVAAGVVAIAVGRRVRRDRDTETSAPLAVVVAPADRSLGG